MLRYLRVLLGEFRWTLLILACAVLVGTLLHAVTPQQSLAGRKPSIGISVYSAWMALFAQPGFSPPTAWYLLVLYGIYPVLGFILVGQGVVRLTLLMISRRRGEREWMLVMASTYRDHVVLCGLGHLGFRVLEQLVRSGVPVVVLERSKGNPFVPQAKQMNVPVLIRDMKEDQALIDAGIVEASAIIICSNDDVSNLEVAIDSRRMNPKVRIVMRLFDQQVASKVAGALTIDAAFSSSALAAPAVAALSLHTTVLSSLSIKDETFVAVQLIIEDGSPLAGQPPARLEAEHGARVLAVINSAGVSQTSSAALNPGDQVITHVSVANLPALAGAARGKAR